MPSSSERDPEKSVGHSVTLPEDTSDMEHAGQIILTLSEMVGRRVRKHGFSGRCVTVTWRYSDMSTHTRQRTLPSHVTNTGDIYRTALDILEGVDLREGVRLLGVSISTESDKPEEFTNGLLFPEQFSPVDKGSEQKDSQLQDALDEINNRYGEFTLSRADSVPELGKQKVISPSWRRKGIRKSD